MIIPKDFKKYFWDSEFSQLKQKKYRNFVLGRLLHYGGMDAIKYVWHNFKRNEVAGYLRRERKDIDMQSLHFWNKLVRMKSLWQ